jgi:hypothetical protein
MKTYRSNTASHLQSSFSTSTCRIALSLFQQRKGNKMVSWSWNSNRSKRVTSLCSFTIVTFNWLKSSRSSDRWLIFKSLSKLKYHTTIFTTTMPNSKMDDGITAIAAHHSKHNNSGVIDKTGIACAQDLPSLSLSLK